VIVLADMEHVRRSAVSGVEGWLNRMLADAGGGGARITVSRDGWLILEADDEELASSILKLYTRLPLIIRDPKPPQTAKVLEVREGVVRYVRPLADGSALRREAKAAEWAVSLGAESNSAEAFLEAVGIVGGAPVSVSLNLPSLLYMRLVREMITEGLDRVLLLDAVPPEVESLLEEPEIGRLVARHEPLTILTHLIYLKLGVRLDRALRKIEERLESLAPGAMVRGLSWQAMAQALKSGI